MNDITCLWIILCLMKSKVVKLFSYLYDGNKILKWAYLSLCCRMESTEKCDVVIQNFNGKFLKTPPGMTGTVNLMKYNFIIIKIN